MEQINLLTYLVITIIIHKAFYLVIVSKRRFYFRGTHEFSKYLQLDASINYTKTFSENPLPQGGGAAPLYWIAYNVPRNFDMNYWKDRYIDPVNGGILRGAAFMAWPALYLICIKIPGPRLRTIIWEEWS